MKNYGYECEYFLNTLRNYYINIDKNKTPIQIFNNDH